jgi:hypothetical protein
MQIELEFEPGDKVYVVNSEMLLTGTREDYVVHRVSILRMDVTFDRVSYNHVASIFYWVNVRGHEQRFEQVYKNKKDAQAVADDLNAKEDERIRTYKKKVLQSSIDDCRDDIRRRELEIDHYLEELKELEEAEK